VIKEIKTSSKGIFIFLAVFYCLYAEIYIYQSSFIIDGTRYYSLFDDAMISMRYAKNFAEGYGPLWNLGSEPIEGYTNPLWTIFMTIPHLLGIPLSKTSLFIQAFSAFFLLFHLFFVRKISDLLSGGSNAVMAFSVGLNILYQPILTWSLLGMEICVLLPLISAALWLTLKHYLEEDSSSWHLLWLGIATMIRLDMVLIFAAFSAFCIITSRNRFETLMTITIILFISIVPLSILRLIYYGDILPNTYYLKMTGIPFIYRFSRGLISVIKFIVYMNPGIFLIPIVYAFFKREKTLIFIVLVFLLQLLYSAYTGGDAWEFRGGANRFTVVVLPGFFILISLTFTLAVQSFFKDLNISAKRLAFYRNFAYLATFLLLITSLNTLKSREDLAAMLLIGKPFTMEFNKKQFETGLLMKKYLNNDATFATPTAGGSPYISELRAIDLLGKNDKYIASLDVKLPEGKSKYYAFNPGHNKWDYNYSIGRFKPDAITSLWLHPEDARPLLDEFYVKKEIDGYEFYFRKDSKNVRWELLDK